MNKVDHSIYQIEQLIEKAYEEEKVDSLPWNYDLSMPLSVADSILNLLKSQDVKEPLEDVVFFVGKPSLDSIVYHVLCRKITFEAMRKDPNIHFMLLKSFNGVMGEDKEGKTLDDQENENRERLEGKHE